MVRLDGDRAVVLTTDFFTPVVDDAFDWGRIAAANALSDVYAMGGEPLVAVNLLAWPRDRIPFEVAAEVLRGGAAVCAEAGCLLAGGHSIDDPEPKYGLAVTGIADPARLLRNDAAVPGTPLTLTKPLGLGVLNNRHKATGEVFDEAVAVMTTLNRDASRAALAAGAVCATDVTGFGLLGHLHKMCRASGVGAVIDAAAVPYLEPTRASYAAGFVPGGSRRNLDWVRPHLDAERRRGRAGAARRRPDLRRPAGRGGAARTPRHRRDRRPPRPSRPPHPGPLTHERSLLHHRAVTSAPPSSHCRTVRGWVVTGGWCTSDSSMVRK